MLRATAVTASTARLLHSSAAKRMDLVSGGVILFTTINLAINLADIAQRQYEVRNGIPPSADHHDDHHGHDDHDHKKHH